MIGIKNIHRVSTMLWSLVIPAAANTEEGAFFVPENFEFISGIACLLKLLQDILLVLVEVDLLYYFGQFLLIISDYVPPFVLLLSLHANTKILICCLKI